MDVLVLVSTLLVIALCIISVVNFVNIHNLTKDTLKFEEFEEYHKRKESKESKQYTYIDTRLHDIMERQAIHIGQSQDSTDKLVQMIEECSNEQIMPIPESVVSEKTEDAHRYYVVCLCTRLNQSKFIRCFISDTYVGDDILLEDLKDLQRTVLDKNSDYQSCEILFFHRIK